MRALIYVRVSTDEQAEDGYSLAAQERACRLYAELHGCSAVVLYCDDGYSGTVATRPAFTALLSAVEPGDMVLVHKLDRFARNTQLLLSTLASFERRGVRLVSITEQIDFSSPIGKVMLTLLASFAQYYSDNLSQETSKGHREKAQRGLWVGPTPYGYRKIDKSHIEPSEDAPNVREMFRLFVDEGLSYVSIAAEMNRRGVTTLDWKSKERRRWVRESVRTVIRNRAYVGYVSSGTVEYRGQHQPLIDESTWARAAAKREANTPKPAQGRHLVKPRYRQVVYCARCGGRMWVKSGTAGPSYACSKRWGGAGCAGQQATVQQIDRQVDQLLGLMVVEPTAYDSALERILIDGGRIEQVIARERYRDLVSRLFVGVTP